MSDPTDPRREHPGTYVVQDRSNQEELTRLHIQDQMITASMGGVLPEQAETARWQRVLDVGCGTGGWLIKIAQTYPDASLLIGVDVSRQMLDFARTQATAVQVEDRVEFHIMDALRMLEFPTHYFDLLNQRFNFSYLRTWDWPKLLQEYQRVVRPGGVIRVTESDIIESNSPALTNLCELCLKALYQVGHFFTSHNNGVTSELAHLLHQHGLDNVQTRAYTIEYRAGTPEGKLFAEDMGHLFQTHKPFLAKWLRLSEGYEQLYQQMLHEIAQPGFVATWNLLTVWGTSPSKSHALPPHHR